MKKKNPHVLNKQGYSFVLSHTDSYPWLHVVHGLLIEYPWKLRTDIQRSYMINLMNVMLLLENEHLDLPSPPSWG